MVVRDDWQHPDAAHARPHVHFPRTIPACSPPASSQPSPGDDALLRLATPCATPLLKEPSASLLPRLLTSKKDSIAAGHFDWL